MHIAEGFLPVTHCVAWYAVSAPFVIHGARRVIAAAEDAEKRGLGVVALNGKMIDAPIIERARWVLQRAEASGIRQ